VTARESLDPEHLTVAELLDLAAELARQLTTLEAEADALRAGSTEHNQVIEEMTTLARKQAHIAKTLTTRVVRASEEHQ
jgi:hypothetical protein